MHKTLALAGLLPQLHSSPGLVNGVVLEHPEALLLLVPHAIWCVILKPPWIGATLGR